MGTARHVGIRASWLAVTVIGLSSGSSARADDYDEYDDYGEEIPSQVDHEGGFVWTTADEEYQLRVGGYLQARWAIEQEAGDRDNGFALPRARPVIDGTGEHGLGFHVMGELAGDPQLLEGWLEWREGPVGVRAGKDRIPFLRSQVMPEHQYAFAEPAVATSAFGWDRDVGVSLRFRPARGPLSAQVMVANGGPDAAPDDVPVVALRIQMTPFGPKPDPGAGDVGGTRPMSATFGVSVVVDAVAAPAAIGEMALTNDLDGDGEAERVVTATTGLDLTYRRRGLELSAELAIRMERWGDLARVNPALVTATDVDPMTGATSFTSASLDATYVIDGKVLVGGRVSAGAVPFLSTHGPSVMPLGKRVVEADAVIGAYRDGVKMFGITYRFLNYGERYDGAGDGPVEHRVVAEAQVVL
jgi:hypothetical protein